MKLSPKVIKKLKIAQQSEIVEFYVYERLADCTKNKHNRQVLRNIAQGELEHYRFLKNITKVKIKPSKWQIWKFYWIARLFGLTFGVKLMEKGEAMAQINYQEMLKDVSGLKKLLKDEEIHEKELIAMLNEKRLSYMGSVVLGLNDALVELTGALAGFTFALQNTHLIALTGLIMGIAASMSMAASEYLSVRTEEDKDEALISSFYTGMAYVMTVVLLITPYFLVKNYLIALGLTFSVAILIIFVFNYYISVAKDYDFKKRFWEMTAISLGVSLISFVIGILVRRVLGVEV